MKLREILGLPIEQRYEVVANTTWPTIDLTKYGLYHVLIGSTPHEGEEWDTEDGQVRQWIIDVFNF